MAHTRSVGKACRLAFSWTMALSGYETCPAEDMEAAVAPQGGRSYTNTTGSVPDAKSSVFAEAISAERAAELRRLILDTGASESRFCAYLKIRTLAELPAARFQAAKAALESKGKSTNSKELAS